LAAASHDVTLLRGTQSSYPLPKSVPFQTEYFTTTSDLASRFLALATDEPLAIFHAAAVSDFTFGLVYDRLHDGQMIPIYGGKIDSRRGALWVELKPTPKILTSLRDWFPNAKVVGWKYEVQGSQEDVLDRARAQLEQCQSDLCVANGPAYGEGFGLVQPDGSHVPLPDATALESRLISWLASV
jgi:phosphopantothenoylcysteine decarboxylase/phosphopantothenate--cysteine ligase